ncbi:MAG: hypothetical protein RR322_06570, partial [Oscillospiraceae bacterium]
LLVSGLGFALVSSFNGLPLSDSPVAKAATTNLRAVASEATEATAEAAFTEEAVAPSIANAVWDLTLVDKTVSTGPFTIACGNFYVTEKAELSKDKGQAAEFKFEGYAIQFADKSGYLAKTTEGKLAKETAKTTALGAFTDAGVAVNYVADGLIIAPVTPTAIFTTADYAVTVVSEWTSSVSQAIVKNLNTLLNISGVYINSRGNDFVARFANNNGYYLAVNDNGTGVMLVATEGEASPITLDGAGYVKLAGKYLNIAKGATTLVDDAGNAQLYTKITETTAGVIQVHTLKVGELNANFVILTGTDNSDYGLTCDNDESVASIDVDKAKEISKSTLELVTAEAVDGGFIFKKGSHYLAEYHIKRTLLPVATKAAATVFKQSDNALLTSGEKVLVMTVDRIQVLKLVDKGSITTEKPVVAYTVTNATDATAATATVAPALANNTPYMLGEYKSLDKAQMLTAKLTASANLIDGETYYIKDGNSQNALHMEKETDGKFYLYAHDLEADCEVALKAAPVITSSTLEALWTAKKIEVTGQVPRYQFKNLETGKLLAFGYDKTDKNVVFNPDGLYNTFEFEDESLIFTVAEKDANGAVIGKLYVDVYVDADADADVITNINKNPATLTFSLPAEKPAGWGVDDQIHYLNVTAGSGNGFGLVFKDKVADKLKDLAVEKNVFSDASMITAVKFGVRMLLKVDGTFPLDLDHSIDANNQEQLKSFRASTFIVVDTVRYSSIIDDQAAKGFIKFTTAKGSEMLNEKGQPYWEGNGSTQPGNKEGVTRLLENALFQIDQVIGGKTTDPVYVYASEACLPEPGNVNGLADHKPLEGAAYIAIKNFNGKYYVGAVE